MDNKETHVYVGRGLGPFPDVPRIFAQPEVVYLTFSYSDEDLTRVN